MASLEETFQHYILWPPKLYTLSVGKFMHSCYNKLLPNHFDAYFNPNNSIHSFSTRLSTSNNLFYLKLTLRQENVPLHLLAQRCGHQHQTALRLLPLLPSNGSLTT